MNNNEIIRRKEQKLNENTEGITMKQLYRGHNNEIIIHIKYGQVFIRLHNVDLISTAWCLQNLSGVFTNSTKGITMK